MYVYTAIAEFALPLLPRRVYIGDSVSKYQSRVIVAINGIEYTNQALYDWVGSPNSLDFLSFVNIVPDPSSITNSSCGSVAIPSGADTVVVAAAAFGFVPTGLVAMVSRPALGGSNLFVTRYGNLTATGFSVSLSAATPTVGYRLEYAVFK